MKKLEIKIKELQDLFKLEILNGNFEIVGYNANVVKMNVGGYRFDFFISDKLKSCSEFNPVGNNFMPLSFEPMESEMLYDILIPKYKKYVRETMIKEKEEELNRLKAEA